ncbi:MAG: hypothetical protein M3Y07_00320 [Acidobacteriota bacterium]|nr:hypothetical protein [Acidobacteriota bacterium]
MGLDIRLPIGLMFSIFGLIVGVYGVMADPAMNRRSLGINIDMWWGICSLIIGAILLLACRRKKPKQ